jgi:2-dehydro-3-deoxyphosphogluconate aldolase/(4S)-4-hydroxy-2-oxoglutarate aldolase
LQKRGFKVNKYEVFEALKRHKIVAVLRGNKDEAKETAERLICGGVRILEITFTVSGAEELIRELREKYNDGISVGADKRKKELDSNCKDMAGARTASGAEKRTEEIESDKDEVIIGAGTVLDAETARAAILAGAEFIVSPAACVEVVRLCNRYSVAAIPGVATATELLSVLEYGADFVKLFPANIEVLRALKAPFPNVNFMVTGGVDSDNLTDFLKAGASAVGAGSNLTKKNADIKKWIEQI